MSCHNAAFPQNYESTPTNGEGLTKLEYFAAHAPPVPDWWPAAKFSLKRLPELPNPEGHVIVQVEPTEVSSWQRSQAWKCWRDSIDDEQLHPILLEEFQQLSAVRERVGAENDAHKLRVQLARESAWRFAYAHEMAERCSL